MNTDLQVFTNEKFGSVRAVEVEGEPWFVAADVCRALELDNVSMAVDRLDDDERGVSPIDTLGGMQRMKIVSESGLYALVLGSRKEEAKTFKRWVTHDIIPAIRKHGGYLTPSKIEEALLNPDVLIRLATDLKLAQEQRKALEMQNAAMLPKADFYDAVMESPTTFDIETVSKILNVGIGRNKLFALLREQNVLRKNRNPFQYYVDLGWFKCVENNYKNRDGVTFVNVKTVVYQKGIDGILKLLKEKYGLVPKIIA